MSARALVTGCAGFIGSQVVRQLLAQGVQVHGVDDLNDAYDPALKRWRLARLEGQPGFRFAQVDIRDPRAVEETFRLARPEVVYNLAARAGVRQSLLDPHVYVATNLTGTLHILDAMRAADTKRLVLASTSSLYGSRNPRPFHEDADTDHPLSPYAASKKGAEAMVAAYAHLYGLDAAVCRYFTVYGPAGRPDMSIFRFVRNITEGEPIVVYGDGEQERDFTFVDDIARGTIAAGTKVRGFERINLGGDRPVKLSRVIELIEEGVGRKALVVRRPMHPADVRATWADIGKARKILEWEPTVSLEEGIARCVAWYQENRGFASQLKTEDI